jgi:threonine dehydrogenase-like Zn-dependent dehydrogenase
LACRKGGVVSVLGVYGVTDKFPTGVLTNKGLTLKTAQQHGQRYVTRLFDYIEQGDLNPAKLITHDLPLEDGVRAYDIFKNKQDGCIRVAMRPGVKAPASERETPERTSVSDDRATSRS